MGVLPLLSRPIESLTVDDVATVAKAFGIKKEINPDIREALLTMLKGHNMDVVSDVLRSPEAIAELTAYVDTISGGALGVNDPILGECPLCEEQMRQSHTQDLGDGSEIVVCPTCSFLFAERTIPIE